MYSVAEAAVIKSVHPNSVRAAIKEGRLPAVRKGNMWLIAAGDLEAWQIVGHRPRQNHG